MGRTINSMSRDYVITPQGLYKRHKKWEKILEPHTFESGKGDTLFTAEGERILTDGLKKRVGNNKFTEKEVVKLLNNLMQEQDKINKQLKTLMKRVDDLHELVSKQSIKTPTKKPLRLKRPPQRKQKTTSESLKIPRYEDFF